MSSELVIKYNPSSRHARGKACLNCRRRKIKCDGERPMCGQCASARGTFDDCEYSDGRPSQAQLLEKKILEVQTRIEKLEKAAQPSSLDSSPNSLHNFPLDDTFIPSVDTSTCHAETVSSANLISQPTPAMPVSSDSVDFTSIGTSASFLDARLSLHPFQEPYTEHRNSMLDAFYSECHHYGLFLIPDRFYQSFLLPLPLGHFSRPTPALLNVVYLWGTHISPSNPGIYDETGFLRTTLYHLTEDLTGSHPQKVIHTMQAEILLSYYYLKNGRPLEGSYHANAALSLSLSAGLNRLHTSWASPLDFHPGSINLPIRNQNTEAMITSLPPPIDLAEENERIDAFWASVILNNCWVAIQESHSMLFDPLDARIDTPWPTDSPYDVISQHCENGNTLQQFIECTTVEGVSVKALHAKATILLEQATTIHPSGFGTDALYSRALTRLDCLIEQFKIILPLSGSFNSLPLERETISLSRMIAHAATIRLHLTSAINVRESHNKCVLAAKAIASITENVVPVNVEHIQLDPIIAVLWIAACEVLMPEVLDASTGNDNDRVLVAFETIMSRMTRFSERNNMMKYLVDQFQIKNSARFKAPS
ncbi:hypothetical protein BDZ94DRAFT_1320301 [Collybia nuda]|uniref:Zn(2)-C6 fungal-type domain-containing protein n=1 Tax=Collybia nuda TaxID=64659 RepID=A0A9P5Y8U8_9AGAR|nr:hypothetical protein BDZ94DRAFT_1320301 [Collybia nuda]